MKKPSDSSKNRHFPLVGIPIAIAACFFNAAMATTIKVIGDGAPSKVIVFMRLIVSLFLISLYLLVVKKNHPLKKTLTVVSWQPIWVRIISGTICLVSYFLALRVLTISDAVLLNFTAPLFLPFCLRIWKKVPFNHKMWAGLVCGFVGVSFIVGPNLQCSQSGIILGLMAGFFASISYAAGRVSTFSDSPVRINFYFFLFSSILTFLFSFGSIIPLIPTFSLKLWLLFALVGVFGTLYQSLIILAFHYAQARYISVFMYSTVIFAMINEWLFFKITPASYSYIGALLIIFGGFLMAILDRSKKLKIK